MVSFANEGSLARAHVPEAEALAPPHPARPALNLVELERAAANIQPVWHEVPVPPAPTAAAGGRPVPNPAPAFSLNPDATDGVHAAYVAKLSALAPPRLSLGAVLIRAQAYALNHPGRVALTALVVAGLALLLLWPKAQPTDLRAGETRAEQVGAAPSGAPSHADEPAQPAPSEARGPLADPSAAQPAPEVPASASSAPSHALAAPAATAPAEPLAARGTKAPPSAKTREPRQKRHEKRIPAKAAAHGRKAAKPGRAAEPAKDSAGLGPNPYL